MNIRNILYSLLILFVIGDLIILYFVYQKYMREPQDIAPSFFLIDDQPLRTYLHEADNLPPLSRKRLHTPFFNNLIQLNKFSLQTSNFYAELAGVSEQLTLSGKIEGTSKDDRHLNAVINIFSGNYNLGTFSASRISGTLELQETMSNSVMAGEMNIGRIKWGNIPLSGMKVILRGTPIKGDLKIRGEVSGHRGTVFEAEALLINNKMTDVQGTLDITYPDQFFGMMRNIYPDINFNLDEGRLLLFEQSSDQLIFYQPDSDDKKPLFALKFPK